MTEGDSREAGQNAAGSLYTIGHSNHPLETFLGLLTQHGIEVLIDTRSSPFSRYAPQFNREALKASVEAAGLRYGFFGRHLGGRPDDEDLYDENGHVLYGAVAKSFLFSDGLERLTAGMQKLRTAILCSEEDPNVCHRRLLISRVLFEAGIDVQHIRGDGRVDTEMDLRKAEVCFAAERQRQIEEKQLAAEQKQQARDARSAARREIGEERASRLLLREQKLELAKREKERKRQEMVERQTLKRQIQADKVSQKAAVPKKVAVPHLFDMEES